MTDRERAVTAMKALGFEEVDPPDDVMSVGIWMERKNPTADWKVPIGNNRDRVWIYEDGTVQVDAVFTPEQVSRLSPLTLEMVEESLKTLRRNVGGMIVESEEQWQWVWSWLKADLTEQMEQASLRQQMGGGQG